MSKKKKKRAWGELELLFLKISLAGVPVGGVTSKYLGKWNLISQRFFSKLKGQFQMV